MKKLLIGILLVGALLLGGCNTGVASSLPATKLIIAEVPLKLVSINSPVWPGDTLNIKIKTDPLASCAFSFVYNRYSLSAGQQSAYKMIKSDADGIATVSLGVPSKDLIPPGYYRLNIDVTAVTGAQASMITTFIVQ